MKKYQSGGKTSQATKLPKGSEIKLPPYQHKKTYEGSPYKSAADSTSKANKIIELERDFLAKHKAMREKTPKWGVETPEVDAARKRYERDPDVANYRLNPQGKYYSSEDYMKIHEEGRKRPGQQSDKYKKGGTIKNPTAMKKQKTAPKKKMSAKELEAMKKANTPMMKYGGKMGKKPC